MSFLLSKNANILAFDELIDTNTSFDGNLPKNSIIETTNILHFLIQKNCVTDIITSNILCDLLKIVTDTNTIITDNVLDDNDNYYFLGGWTGHAILLFYEKNKNDSNLYDIGIINAGEGSVLQGYADDICNGIIIFKNIPLQKLLSFITDYNNFSTHHTKTSKKYIYYPFYFILLKNLLDIEEINFHNLISNNNVIFLRINSQIIGSCGFTNHINYLCYNLGRD